LDSPKVPNATKVYGARGVGKEKRGVRKGEVSSGFALCSTKIRGGSGAGRPVKKTRTLAIVK